MVFKTWNSIFGTWISQSGFPKLQTWKLLGHEFQDVGPQFWDLDFALGVVVSMTQDLEIFRSWIFKTWNKILSFWGPGVRADWRPVKEDREEDAARTLKKQLHCTHTHTHTLSTATHYARVQRQAKRETERECARILVKEVDSLWKIVKSKKWIVLLAAEFKVPISEALWEMDVLVGKSGVEWVGRGGEGRGRRREKPRRM
jgi:hypothetical protein